MDDVRSLFESAAQDAGIDPVEVFLKVLWDIAGVNGNQAVSWPSELVVNDEDELWDLGDHVAELNGSARNMYRIVLCVDVNPVANSALLRHELEHLVQFNADSRLYRQHEFAVSRLVDTFGSSGSQYYNMIPMELEANLAASRFVRAQYGDLRVNQLYESRPDLRRLLKEYQHPSLVRMQQFLAVFDAVKDSQS